MADFQLSPPLYRIDEVAERTGLTKRTLRYYEEIGLLRPPARTDGNYRLYTDEDIARIQHIRQMRSALGLTLADINIFLRAEDERVQLRTSYHQTTDHQERREQLHQARALTLEQIAIIDAKLQTLNDLRAKLVAKCEAYDARDQELATAPTDTTG